MKNTTCHIARGYLYSSFFETKLLYTKVERCFNYDMKGQLPGATMISCFFDLILRKVRSFWGSMSRTVLLVFIVSWWRRPAYWTVVELSKVVLIGMPVTRFNCGLKIYSDYKRNMHIVEILARYLLRGSLLRGRKSDGCYCQLVTILVYFLLLILSSHGF